MWLKLHDTGIYKVEVLKASLHVLMNLVHFCCLHMSKLGLALNGIWSKTSFHWNISKYNTVFGWENFCKFCGFVAIRESFLWKIWKHGVLWQNKSEQSVNIFHQFAKVFSLKSFPLYVQYIVSKYGEREQSAQKFT